MPDDMLPFDKTRDPALSRRAFAALSLGAGAAVTASAMAADAVVETDVVIKMADGDCDAALFHPSGSGSWPGAVIFADALGLRPAFRDMARRDLAAVLAEFDKLPAPAQAVAEAWRKKALARQAATAASAQLVAASFARLGAPAGANAR